MGEKRESFVFYRSFLGAIREMGEADQLAMFWAICDYALDGKEPALPSAIQRAVFAVIRPNIDINIARREGGKKGGRTKSAKKKTSPQTSETIGLEKENLPEQGFETENHRFAESASTETETEAVTEAEDETETAAAEFKDPGSRTDKGLARLIQDYQQELGSFPRSALEKLQDYRAALGDELVGLAIQEAAQHNARSWSYLDGVLDTWRKEGVRTPGDVQARRDRARQSAQRRQTPSEPRYEVLR